MKTDLTVGGYVIHDEKILLIHHKKLDLWLPVGGHIDENETPDEALLREIREEVGLEVKILNQTDIPFEGNMKKHLAIPFCKPLNPENLQIDFNELKNYRWFSKEELNEDCVPIDVRNISLKAFELFENLPKDF